MGAGRSNNNATLRRISDDQTFAAQVQTEGDKLVVTSNAIGLTMEAGESFEVSVPNVSDEYNNSMSSAVTWNFMVAENISSSALAMELLEFKGEQLAESNLLSWNTINEELMDSYVVEPSTDGRDFEQLEAILAFNEKSEMIYEWIDKTPPATAYYRLRMVDLGGKTTYSSIIRVTRETTTAATYGITKLYPNPTDGLVNVEFTAAVNSQVTIRVFDIAGKVMLQRELATEGALNQQRLELSGLLAGTYLLQLEYGDGEREVRRVMVK
ncbi:MAG: T9SS type A sorting domain-containing protein, partial [Saprospiraceae bacterium]